MTGDLERYCSENWLLSAEEGRSNSRCDLLIVNPSENSNLFVEYDLLGQGDPKDKVDLGQ